MEVGAIKSLLTLEAQYGSLPGYEHASALSDVINYLKKVLAYVCMHISYTGVQNATLYNSGLKLINCLISLTCMCGSSELITSNPIRFQFL